MYSKFESALNICYREYKQEKLIPGIEPKVVRAVMVAKILEKYTKNDDIIVAALLHEIPMTRLQRLYSSDKKLFNKYVQLYLRNLSRGPINANWRDRSVEQLKVLAKAPFQAVMIKTAVYINNLEYILENFKCSSAIFEQRFGYSPKEIWSIYAHLCEMARSHSDIPRPMINELAQLISKFKNRFQDSL